MQLTLTNPTDDQLNAVFDTHVAKMGERGELGPVLHGGEYKLAYPQWTRSMDAVLPWLEKAGLWECGYSAHHDGYWVTVSYGHDSEDRSLPRAAVIALLRANGVEVVFK
jgi:hypothetical protein